MKVYISGPMTGLSEWRILKLFNEAAEQLEKEGYTPVNPAVLFGNPGLEYEDYMKIDFAMIDVCDGIYMLEGWENSNGAKRELAKALIDGKEVVSLD